jgi:hypothetical protein
MSKLRTTGAVLMALVMAAALSGCVQEFGNARCDFNVQHPHQSNSMPTHMDAKVSIKCTAIVTQVRVEIKMQRLWPGGIWKEVPGSYKARETASLAAGRPFTVTTGSTRCVAGTFRAAGRGSATLGTSPNASASWQYGPSVKVVCRKA